MSETRTLWQRCEALGQFEDFKDEHVEMYFEDERWVIHHDGHPIAFIYEDRMQGSPWLADAILCHIERLRFGSRQDILDNLKADLRRHFENCPPTTIDRLPDVTYVVEAPKPTEPTQEQLKAIWDHVTHLTGEQAKSFGFQYAVIGNAAQSQFELQIKSLGSRFGEWQIKIMHGHIGRYWWENPFDLVTTARLINMAITIPTNQYVFESPEQFVSIRVTEWQQLREAHKTIQSILFPEIKEVEFEN